MRDGLAPYLVVVPRGERATYRALQVRVKDQGLVEVIWDRRVVDRRQTPTAGRRRLGERRRPGDDTWTLGFLVAARHDGVLEPTKTVEKPGSPPVDLAIAGILPG